jgi:alkaline phosphatase D
MMDRYGWVAILLSIMLMGGAAPDLAAQDASETLRSGPMVGYGTHREAALWLQTTRPADVQIRYWSVTDSAAAADDPAVIFDPDTLLTPPQSTTAAGDHIAQFTISDLEPGNTYAYSLFIDGARVDRPYPLRFQTQPLWQWRTDPPTFTVGVGSCAYINQPQYDRPGDPYGGDYQIFEHLAARNPDLMLWMGDNVYYREVDWAAPNTMAMRYAHTRQTPEMQPLLGHTHHYATWDDHDYGPNNANRSYAQKEAALDIFKRYWANPTYGRPDVPGVFGQFSWNDVDFFLLDDRYHRAPNRAPQDTSKTMWGNAQLDWLIDALTTSRAPFKIVVNGGQILNPTRRAETLARFPDDRKRLLNTIIEREIEGVLFLSGDRHFTALSRHTPEGFYPLYEFTNSPLTAGAYNPTDEPNPYRLAETLVPERNFGLLTFSGPRTDRELTIRVVDKDGNEEWTRTIRARDLRMPGK